MQNTFSFEQLDSLNFNDQKNYLTQFFVPLLNGSHCMLKDGLYEMMTDEVINKVYLKRCGKKLREYYEKKSPQIKTRTLLVSETSMGRKFEKSDIPSIYPFKVEVCSRSKIEKAINDRSKDYYYLQPGITLNKSYSVIDPSNGEVLFFDFDMQGLNITKKNIENLVEKIKM